MILCGRLSDEVREVHPNLAAFVLEGLSRRRQPRSGVTWRPAPVAKTRSVS